MSSNLDVLLAAVRRRKQWWFWTVALRAVHYTLGVLAIIASIVAGALKPGGIRQTIAIATTGICGAVVSFVNPARLSSSYIKAWRRLDSAIRHYESAPDVENLKRINDAIDEGEFIIEASDAATTDERGRIPQSEAGSHMP